MMSATGVEKVCGACSKQGRDLKKCAACTSVWYCGVDCQRAHRAVHRRACKRKEKELEAAADFLDRDRQLTAAIQHLSIDEKNDDDALFQPCPKPECPVCMLPLPNSNGASVFMACCGAMVCGGCMNEMDRVINEENRNRVEQSGRDHATLLKKCCPFCRDSVKFTDAEVIAQVEALMRKDNHEAFFQMAIDHDPHAATPFGSPQDSSKAFSLYIRAAELGSSDACYNLAHMYREGINVKADASKQIHYLKLAATGGCIAARHNLGHMELMAGMLESARKHLLISAAAGDRLSINDLFIMYKSGSLSKVAYQEALRAHQKSLDDEKSEQRERAALKHPEFMEKDPYQDNVPIPAFFRDGTEPSWA
ncbi:hypothetical protein ACHAXR_002164 [Thalassiosira sp. AJA248-18]